MWQKALRQIWKLSYRTHCDIVACLTDMPCARHMFMQRMLKFANSAMNHKVPVVAYVMQNAMSIDSSLLKAMLSTVVIGTSYMMYQIIAMQNLTAWRHVKRLMPSVWHTPSRNCFWWGTERCIVCWQLMKWMNYIINFSIVKKFPILCVPLGTK